jgi:lysophospholipase L1-like esterase
MKTQKIEDIDKNFVAQKVGDRELIFADIAQTPFAVSGLGWFYKEKKYCRLPESRLPETNEGVRFLAWNTAGAMVRFRSNSKTLALRYELNTSDDMSHMPRTGISGFDLYRGGGTEKKFAGVSIPPPRQTQIEAVWVASGSGQTEEWTLNFPLYNGVKTVSIGFDPGCTLEPPTPFTFPKPVAFYGSSITQGGCASRPGNAYTHLVCRWLDANLLNFGFSGNARAEPIMAELMMSLDLSALVLDYDHNAPSADYLEQTHEPFYKLLRQAKPNLPLILVGRPDFNPENVDCRRRQAIIRRTFENAVAAGDRRIYHLNNELLLGTQNRDACTVDGCHPNDLGFMRMAEAIYPVVRQALQNNH